MKNLTSIFCVIIFCGISSCSTTDKLIKIPAKLVSNASTRLIDGGIISKAITENGDTIDVISTPCDYWSLKKPIAGDVYIDKNESRKVMCFVARKFTDEDHMAVTIVKFIKKENNNYYCYATTKNTEMVVIKVNEALYLNNKIPFKGIARIDYKGDFTLVR